MEKKELVHSGILYDMSEGVIVISPDGTISLVNPAAEHILDAVYDPDARHVNVVPYYTGTMLHQLHVTTSFLRSGEEKTGIIAVLGDISELVELRDAVAAYGADQGAQQPAGAAQPPAAYNLWQVSLR